MWAKRQEDIHRVIHIQILIDVHGARWIFIDTNVIVFIYIDIG